MELNHFYYLFSCQNILKKLIILGSESLDVERSVLLLISCMQSVDAVLFGTCEWFVYDSFLSVDKDVAAGVFLLLLSGSITSICSIVSHLTHDVS